jgi:hypothetical protein
MQVRIGSGSNRLPGDRDRPHARRPCPTQTTSDPPSAGVPIGPSRGSRPRTRMTARLRAPGPRPMRSARRSEGSSALALCEARIGRAVEAWDRWCIAAATRVGGVHSVAIARDRSWTYRPGHVHPRLDGPRYERRILALDTPRCASDRVIRSSVDGDRGTPRGAYDPRGLGVGSNVGRAIRCPHQDPSRTRDRAGTGPERTRRHRDELAGRRGRVGHPHPRGLRRTR